jgi:hypothetical protein
MIDTLDRKIRQMHLALENIKNDDFSTMKIERGKTVDGFYCAINLNDSSSDIELANIASLLVSNIACLKDHLKIWCKKYGCSFEGDKLIDSNLSVALVHDLWNVDKHAELNSPPRSGHHPKLIGLRRTLALSSGTQPGSSSSFSFNLKTGEVITGTSGSGTVNIELFAQIVDETNTVLGLLGNICKQAAEAWEQELKKAGVPIP